MIGCLPTQAFAFLAVFVYATHATQAIAFEWKDGFTSCLHPALSCAAASIFLQLYLKPSVPSSDLFLRCSLVVLYFCDTPVIVKLHIRAKEYQ